MTQVIAETTGGQTNLYLTGLAQYAGDAWAYQLPDALGSVRQLADSGGQIILAQTYDPYGNPVEQIGTATSGFGYTGEQFDDTTGLLNLRARYYRPETGTFLNKDPIESEPPYLYVRGNPINYIDPSGMQCSGCPPKPGATATPGPVWGGPVPGPTIVPTPNPTGTPRPSEPFIPPPKWRTAGEVVDSVDWLYSKGNPYWNCYNHFTGTPHLTDPSPNDNWYDVVRDFVCEYGPNPRIFRNNDAIADSIMRSTFMTEARRDFYTSGGKNNSGTRPFGNPSEPVEAELDHFLGRDYAAAGRILGTFSYIIERDDSETVFILWNTMSRESGSRLPIRAKYSLEEMLQNGSLDSRTPIINIPKIKSILRSKERHQTQDPEGGGNLYTVIMWRELSFGCSIMPSIFSAPVPTPLVGN